MPLRDNILIVSSIVLIAALAWAYLVLLQQRMSPSGAPAATMAGMGMMDAPWRTTDVLFTLTMWFVMMVGMMSPAAAPVLLLFAATRARRAERGAPTAVLLFGLGYFTVWLGFSACATLAQWALHDAALLSPAMAAASGRVAGALLIAAGAYQLTPAKRACLQHCQSPVGFLMSHWRDGRGGALRMGFHHGLYCLGCCWALMTVLLVVGIMNLLWMAVIAAVFLAEKNWVRGDVLTKVAGTALVVYGVAVMVKPEWLPGGMPMQADDMMPMS